MIKAHKIRLHPTPEQANYFARAAGTARFTFNWARAEWQKQYEAGGKPSALALRTQFNEIKKDQFPWVYDVTKCAVEGAFMDVAAAFKNFFEGRKAGRKTGYPKFKSKKHSRPSFFLANGKFTVGDHWMDVPKLGRVNMAETVRFYEGYLNVKVRRVVNDNPGQKHYRSQQTLHGNAGGTKGDGFAIGRHSAESCQNAYQDGHWNGKN